MLSETFEAMQSKFQQVILATQSSSVQKGARGEQGSTDPTQRSGEAEANTESHPEMKETEWYAYQDQLNDWLVKIEQAKRMIGLPQTEKDMARNLPCVPYAVRNSVTV